MLVVVWEYRARPDRIEDFEALYRADGAWARLFQGAPGFVSTTLMKDVRDPLRFMVADRWTSETLYDEFKRDHDAEYATLSRRGEALFEREQLLGRFDFRD